MSTTSDELLRFAQHLLDNAHGALDLQEASHRAASSRAYYAAFHSCSSLSKKISMPTITIQRGGAHLRLIRQFETFVGGDVEKQATTRAIGNMLRRCRDLRTEADYELNRDFMREQALDTLNLAESIRRQLQSIWPSSNR